MICLQKHHTPRKMKAFTQFLELNKYGYIRPRDIDILKNLYRFRFMTTSQIDLIHFNNIKKCRRRLMKLYNYGLIDRFRPVSYNTGTSEYIYCLDGTGVYFLSQSVGKQVADLNWRKRDNQVNLMYVYHYLEVANVFIELQRFNIKVFKPEPDLKYLQPDIYLEISHLGYRFFFFIEVDRATEWQKKIRQKIRAYERYSKENEIMPVVIFKVPDEDREKQLNLWIDTKLKVLVTTDIKATILKEMVK